MKKLRKHLKTLAIVLTAMYLLSWFRYSVTMYEIHREILLWNHSLLLQIPIAYYGVKVTYFLYINYPKVKEYKLLGIKTTDLSAFLVKHNGFPSSKAKEELVRDNGFKMSNNIHSKISKYLKDEINCLYKNPLNQNQLELKDEYTVDTLCNAIEKKINLFDIKRD